ncbi:vascular non-inflammatory molecule 3-like, partial [Anneissia japonica]|uniref:vascular non-inflammatory molecule 3-like n=1 Tax=Anneissia japonica TaxID=1529436 RepID=UPI00142554BB
KESALKVINKNLNHYEELIQTASQQNASIVVFPEYGITGFGQSRKTAKVFGEVVPNPYITVIIPCNDLTNSTILRKLSCFAKQYNIVVVANMITIEACLPNDSHCPRDGHYVYNTDVAFERNGQLVAHYNKINVYADEKQIFDTP